MTHFSFQPQNYGAWCSEFVSSEILPPLGPGSPDRPMGDVLSALTTGQLFRDTGVADRQMASCCLAGLWLLFDYLDDSHQLSQRIHSTSGSLWHGIMHRREPDPSNAKYWFRMVGDHPIYDALAVATAERLTESDELSWQDVLDEGSSWDAFRFVDLCEKYRDTATPQETTCRKIAQLEWQLLFDHCYRLAVA